MIPVAVAKVVALNDFRPHKVGYAVCSCGFRAVCVCPVATDDQALECDSCGGRTLRFVSREIFQRRGTVVSFPTKESR